MPSQYVLTTAEAKVVRAINDDANTYELASATKLTASEVNDVVARLVDKQLARTKEEGRYVALTDQGYYVRRLLVGANQRRAFGSNESAQVLIVPEPTDSQARAAGAGAADWAEADEKDLDDALEAEIQKLRHSRA